MNKELFNKIEKLITEIRELESELEKWDKACGLSISLEMPYPYSSKNCIDPNENLPDNFIVKSGYIDFEYIEKYAKENIQNKLSKLEKEFEEYCKCYVRRNI